VMKYTLAAGDEAVLGSPAASSTTADSVAGASVAGASATGASASGCPQAEIKTRAAAEITRVSLLKAICGSFG
jgi:hypothetical protein